MTLLNVYLAFIRHGRQSRWCSQNFLNFRSLSRAVEIRRQLLGYLKRFKMPLVSCDGDVDAILRCLVAGCFANAARLGLDGKYVRFPPRADLRIGFACAVWSLAGTDSCILGIVRFAKLSC